ncbi:MAG: Ldh family oxidoreductase [Alphaproteobacteria bacterium]|nr:Ldh family oxidoreductase [Alphaproteobacteria bacterium]
MAATKKASRVHLMAAEGQALGEAAMRGAGYDRDEAQILARHVMDAALCGYEYSGLPKLLNIIDDPLFGAPRQPVSVIKDSGAAVLLDGGGNTGMIALHRAAETAIERATTHGLALVGLANSWMSGRSAHYCEMIARAGLVAIHTVAAPPMVAPFGGKRPALGTNPIAFGFPTSDEPLVIDMGTSAFMGTDLQFRDRLGVRIPDGVALDSEGAPTTDAGSAIRGTLLPFGGPEGGYKGFGLALAMDALGALAAAIRPKDAISGYFFLAFKPDLFQPMEDYRREISKRIEVIKATPRMEGVEEIRIPGERGQAERRRSLVEGIEIDTKIFDALNNLARGQLDHGG